MTATARLRRLGGRPLAIVRQVLSAPADLSTAEGRAQERRRRAAITSLMAMTAKAVSVATALITVPITLHYLGAERYGMWMILSSLVAMLAFADLGIGNGVLSTVAAAYGRDDTAGIRRAVSSGAIALCGVALLVLALFAIAYPFVEWSGFFNVRSARARAEAGPAIAVFVLCFALSVPVTIVQRVQMGMQRGFLASLWLCISSLATLPAVVIATWLQAGLPALVAVLMGVPILAGLLNTIVFFGWQQPGLRPSPRLASRGEIVGTVRHGLMFVLIQLGNAVSAGAAAIIIAHVAGADRVALYTVPERLLALVTMLVSMYVQPLWPAYREALTRGDVAWVAHTHQRVLVQVALVAAAALTALGLAMPALLRVWVGGAVQPGAWLIAGLCAYKLAECILWVNAMVLNGFDSLRAQTVMALVNAILYVGIAIVTCGWLGIAAVPWSAVAILVLVTLVPGFLIIGRRIAALTEGDRV